MKLEEIFEEWDKDCSINKSELGTESLDRPVLHNKYLKIMTIESVKLRQLKADYDTMNNLRAEWYMGRMSEEKLKSLAWEPNPLRIMKDDLSRHIKSDKFLIKVSLQIGEQEELISHLASIIDQINKRGWDIKNCLEWLKFTNGG